MAETLDDGVFWLPSHFLTEDDILMNKENFNKNGSVNTGIGRFPTEFPYGFGSSSALSSPVGSVVSSIETESDEEDFLVGLTRQLARYTLQETQRLAAPTFIPETPEKTWVLAGSPQSTLSTVGSWSGSNGSPTGLSQVSSPPTTPLSANNDAWDLIYAAAGQVARLKMNGEGPKYHHQGRGLLGPPRNPTQYHPPPPPPVKNPNNTTGFYSNHAVSPNPSQSNQFQRQDQVMKKRCASLWGRQAEEGWFSQQPISQNRGRAGCGGGFENGRCGRPLGLPQSAWPPLKQHQQPQEQSGSGMRAVFLGGSSMKRECAGTGVFLPRRFGNPSDSRKKPAGCSTVLLPARVVQALNLNFEHMNAHGRPQPQPQPQPRFNVSFAPDHDALMAGRNGLLANQRRSLRSEGALNHEIRLPQEWTY